MYGLLFNVSSLAILGWLMMIFLPRWSVTQRLAAGAVFPLFLALLYLIGIVPLVVQIGPRIMLEYLSVDGVLGLLSRPEGVLIAWIHILVFDHLLGVIVYRDNMHHRFVSLPVQSVILFFVLMFGPVGFLAYYAIRMMKAGEVMGWAPATAGPQPMTHGRASAGGD